MKLLYGTGNLAKLSAMRNRLEQLDIIIAREKNRTGIHSNFPVWMQ